MPDNLVLLEIQNKSDRWVVQLSFRGTEWTLNFRVDSTNRLRLIGKSALAFTREGEAILSLVDRVRNGDTLSLPLNVNADNVRRHLPSIYDENFNAQTCIKDVWLETATQIRDGYWSVQLRVDGSLEIYELEILPGPTLYERKGPQDPTIQTFTYDLHRLLLRMNAGERFALPFHLRPRWPQPTEAEALR
jgi:hypothetical protein